MNLYRNEVISESQPLWGDDEAAEAEDAGTIPPSSVSPFEMDTQLNNMEFCGDFDRDFYSELTKLKRENIGKHLLYYVKEVCVLCYC